jgi:hypothetical protein
VGNGRQVTLAHFAPAADVFASEFNEIDRPIVFVLPFDGRDLSLILINLDNRTRPDNGVHGSIAHANEAINAVAQI